MVTKIYPKATTVFNPSDLMMGSWPTERPQGITIHHSADRSLEHVKSYGIQEHVGYHLIIDRNGTVHQCANLDQRVNHAGNAKWLGISPNRNHIAVCLISWGRLKRVGDEFQSWTSKSVPHDAVAERPGNLSAELAYWDEATEAQEASLWELLVWLCRTYRIEPKAICGHDECATPKGRKDDPGGVLSMTMQQVRLHIKP